MRQRPTAKDLLKHKFIRNAKKATYLTELIERYEKYKEGKPAEEKADVAATIGSVTAISLPFTTSDRS